MANDNSISSDLIRGHIDTIILRSLYDGDKHGNEICLDIEDKSGGQYELKQPTLYSALKRMETGGLVSAYWSSGDGSGRRRYFKLTDQGRKTCEENFELWIHSRNVIDKLISDGGDLGYPMPEFIPSAPLIPKFDPKEFENYSFTPISEDELEEFDEPIVFPENNTQEDIPAPVLKAFDDSDPEIISQAEENENVLSSIVSSGVTDFDVTQMSLIPEDSTDEAIDLTEEILDNSLSENKEVAVSVEETADDIVSSYHEPEPANTQIQPQEVTESKKDKDEEIIGSDEPDDYLVLEPYSLPEKEYSDILATLFPSEITNVPEEQLTDVNEPEQSAEEESEPIAREITEADEADYDIKPSVVTVEESRIKAEPEPISAPDEAPQKNPNDIDYTDILSMANMQGFRVRTADKTNRALKGKLFINKLIALSSTVLYLLMLLELLVICLPINDILRFTELQYIYFASALLTFPIITYLILLFNKNKLVDSIPTMKYCVTAAVVIMLNLLLLTFALTLILKIDLYEPKNIVQYIILPFVIYLNIPLYFIIKYSILSKGWFITKTK